MDTLFYRLGILLLFLYLSSEIIPQIDSTIVWTFYAGGSSDEAGMEVKPTFDGGFIVVGWTESYGAGGRDVWLIKTSADGNQMWEKTFGGLQDDEGQSVIQTPDGGYIIAGCTDSYGTGGTNLWLIKTDSNGNQQWKKTLGEIKDRCKVHRTLDGGYIISGTTPSGSNGSDMKLIKTDSNGNVSWFKQIGSSVNDVCYSMKITLDGGYILCGYRYVAPFNFDALLIKTDSIGNVVWEQTFGLNNLDWAEDVSQTSDGGYIITGTVTRTDTYQNIWLIKTDASGEHQWDTNYGGVQSEGGYGVKQTNDGGYIIVGFTVTGGIPGSPDIWLIKTNFQGAPEWREIVGYEGDDYGYDVITPEDSVYIFTGMSTLEGHSQPDLILAKDTDGVVYVTPTMEVPTDFTLYQNYPNPFNPTTAVKYQIPELSFVTIKVYDVLGSEIALLVNEEKSLGSYGVEFDGSELPSGIYLYKIQAGDFVETKKMVLIK